MTANSLAMMKSVGVHLLLGSLLVVSMEMHTPALPELQVTAQPIQAVAVDAKQIQQQLDEIERQKQAEIQRQQDIERKAREKEQRAVERKLEEKRRAEQAAAEARKRKAEEKEKARKLEEDRKRKEREKKAAEETARKERERKAAEEKARKEEAERKKQEAAERAEQERMMQEQLQAEQQALAAVRGQQVAKERDIHIVRIKTAISQKWLYDPTMVGKFCRLNLRVATNGLVLKVTVLEGDPAVCRSAETAIYKTESLPVHEDPEVFREFLNFNLTMRPENQ